MSIPRHREGTTQGISAPALHVTPRVLVRPATGWRAREQIRRSQFTSCAGAYPDRPGHGTSARRPFSGTTRNDRAGPLAAPGGLPSARIALDDLGHSLLDVRSERGPFQMSAAPSPVQARFVSLARVRTCAYARSNLTQRPRSQVLHGTASADPTWCVLMTSATSLVRRMAFDLERSARSMRKPTVELAAVTAAAPAPRPGALGGRPLSTMKALQRGETADDVCWPPPSRHLPAQRWHQCATDR